MKSFHQFNMSFLMIFLTLVSIMGFHNFKVHPIPAYWNKNGIINTNNQQQQYSIGTKTLSTTLFANPRRIDVGGDVFQANSQFRHDLLTSSDEFTLSRQYKLGMNIQKQAQVMSEELGREVSYPELSEFLLIPSGQIKDLIEKGEMAKRRLVGANMRLVLHIAKYYRYRGIAYPDLVQEGTFGLVKAVDKYDPERGFRFSTYASWWIKQAISRAVAEKSRIVRLPVHIHDLMVSLARAERSFLVMNGRKPTTAELAERLALPIQKVELLVKSKREVNSIDEDAFSGRSKNGGSAGNNEVQVKDRIASDVLEPASRNENVYLRKELRRSMQSLNEREAQILEMRFGLVDGNSKTLEEIGKIFNVTRERVRQIEARALSKLRHPEMTSELKEIFQDHSLVVPEPVTAATSTTATVTSSTMNSILLQPSASMPEITVLSETTTVEVTVASNSMIEEYVNMMQ